MHSPSELPQLDINDYIELTPNIINHIAYNTWTMKLLGKQKDFLWTQTYKTNCTDYDPHHSKYDRKMRSNCFKGCIQNKIYRCSGCGTGLTNSYEKCLHFTPDLWTANDFDDNGISLFCSFINMTEVQEYQTGLCRSTNLIQILSDCKKAVVPDVSKGTINTRKWADLTRNYGIM